MASRSLGVLTLDLVLKLGGFTQGMDRAARETQRSMARIESSIKGAQRGFALFTRGLAAIGVGFGLGSIVRGFADATKEAIKFGDEIGKAMAKTGLGAEAMSELAAVAKASEVELDTLTTALRNMQVVISDAAAGNKAAALVLKDLGLTFKDLQALKPDQQFELIAQRISEFGSEADRAALRQDVFKRAAEGLAPIMEKGAEGIRLMREEFRRLGVTLSEDQVAAFQKADDAIDKATLAYDSLKRSIGGVLAEPITEFFNAVAEAIGNATNETLSFGDKVGLIAEAYKRAFADKGILAGPQDLAAAYAQITEEANKAAAATKQFGSIAETLGFPKPPAATRTRTTRDEGASKTQSEAERAQKAIQDLLTTMEQQIAVTGETEEATIRYRIALGDLADDFEKAGPKAEAWKDDLILAARALDQFKASEELDKANEQIAQQVIELQAARIAQTEGAAAAYAYLAAHGELAKTLDLATDSQEEYNAALKRGQDDAAQLEFEQAVTSIQALVTATTDASSAIIATAIAEEQGAVAAIKYRIAHGDLKQMFEELGPAAAEWQKKLEDAAAAQEVLTQKQAEDAASEAIIPSRTKALKEYDNALAGLNRRLAEGEISQRDFDQAVKIAEKNFEEATKAIDDMSVFAEQAARNMQDAFADFLFDPFESGLEGMLESFSDTLRRMAAEVVAAQIAEKFNFEDIFAGGGIFGGGGLFGGGGAAAPTGGVLAPIDITAQRIPEAGAVLGGAAEAAKQTAATTAAATTFATAITTAGATAAAAFTAAGTTVAAALTAAGASAAAAIAAAGAAGAASGLASIPLAGFDFSGAGFAKGGPITGPGTGTSDSIPARLSAGEFVVKAEAVRVPGVQALLEKINDGALFRGFAAGGLVRPYAAPQSQIRYMATGGLVNAVSGPTGGREPTIIQQSITVNAPTGHVSRQTEMQLTAAAARGAKAADRHNN